MDAVVNLLVYNAFIRYSGLSIDQFIFETRTHQLIIYIVSVQNRFTALFLLRNPKHSGFAIRPTTAYPHAHRDKIDQFESLMQHMFAF